MLSTLHMLSSHRRLPATVQDEENIPVVSGSPTGQHSSRTQLTAHPATHLVVVLKGPVSPREVDACQASEGCTPKEQSSWKGLQEAGEGAADFWG